jgi:hypothetical protein
MVADAQVSLFAAIFDARSLAKIGGNCCLAMRLNLSEIFSLLVVEFVCALQTAMLVFNPFSQTVTFVNH